MTSTIVNAAMTITDVVLPGALVGGWGRWVSPCQRPSANRSETMNAKGQAKELREQAERTREALGETAQELADRLDVRARADEGLQKGLAAAQQAAAQAKDTATHTLDQADKKIDDLPEAVREPAHRTVGLLRQRPGLVLAGLAGLILVLRLLMRRSRG
jgi:hypothetical protein